MVLAARLALPERERLAVVREVARAPAAKGEKAKEKKEHEVASKPDADPTFIQMAEVKSNARKQVLKLAAPILGDLLSGKVEYAYLLDASCAVIGRVRMPLPGVLPATHLDVQPQPPIDAPTPVRVRRSKTMSCEQPDCSHLSAEHGLTAIESSSLST